MYFLRYKINTIQGRMQDFLKGGGGPHQVREGQLWAQC